MLPRLLLSLLLLPTLLPAGKLGTFGEAPDWSELERYDEVLTRGEVRRWLDAVYAPSGSWRLSMELKSNRLRIMSEGEGWQEIRFRRLEDKPASVHRYWKAAAEIRAKASQEKPLAGLHLALDPGHLGGAYAAMERRQWSHGEGPVIREGELVLVVAQRLQQVLTRFGAKVSLVRDSDAPLTKQRPEALMALAKQKLIEKGKATPSQKEIREYAELLFYRVAEIRARAARVNEQIKPDVVLALHLNAEGWPAGGGLSPRNHSHLLVNGAYSADELDYDDQRYAMLLKLFQGCAPEEIALADRLAVHMRATNSLPPYEYRSNTAVRVSDSDFVWARNLIANRLYQCPTIFLEPYVANSEAVYPRLQAYLRGERPDILDEYVQGVVNGLLAYYAPGSQ